VIETILQWDKELYLLINSWNSPLLNSVMVVISGQIIWFPFIIGFLYYGFKNLDRKSFYLFALFLALGIYAADMTSSYLLKNHFLRFRPCKVPELRSIINRFGQKCGGKYGFVSSHASNSFFLVAFSVFALELKSKWKHALWILPIMVSYSRLYLGVHYPSDVTGGAIVGIGWAWCLTFYFKHRSWRKSGY